MYARLLQDPEIAAMFDRAARESGEQPRRLAGAILAYARNIDKLQNVGSAVQRMTASTPDCAARFRWWPITARPRPFSPTM